MIPDESGVIAYCPDTGLFTWLIASGKVTKGTVGGYARADGYRYVRYEGKPVGAHRLAWKIMTGNWPAEQIDHINRVRDDNRWPNLRLANRSQNRQNTAVGLRNTSGLKGAFFHKPSGRWHAGICVNGRNKYLGHFDSAEAAHEAYVNEAKNLYGEFFCAG